jgi:hypothetical protein
MDINLHFLLDIPFSLMHLNEVRRHNSFPELVLCSSDALPYLVTAQLVLRALCVQLQSMKFLPDHAKSREWLKCTEKISRSSENRNISKRMRIRNLRYLALLTLQYKPETEHPSGQSLRKPLDKAKSYSQTPQGLLSQPIPWKWGHAVA